MKILILAAGYSTRLYPLTLDIPKPLLEIGDRKMLDHLLDRLRPLPHSEIVLVSNHRFVDQFQVWSRTAGLPITVLDDGSRSEQDRLGAVGDMAFAVRERSIGEPMLVVAGDNLFDFPLEPFVAEFEKKSAPLVGLYEYPRWQHLSKYGIVTLDEAGRFSEFVEKPKEPRSNLVSMCLYVFPADTLPFLARYLSGSDPKDAPGHYIRWLMGQCGVHGHRFRGVWLDIGDLDSLEEARKIFGKKESIHGKNV
ncbi:MAG: hypothetical protein A3G34_10325 [Candidatus Lindowbacteria bacterium RIFCSPLOWO2_12_FULL_62_27]|nr:MAG: hypothetical protein A3G34_10325 [Candidatus Lindowbacteria bacterium RIFCSPLOWO2_12_FULL_62_27]OGH63021.1 MAG: hypothetical protein A3I06_01570 [Candidatus Lindowbacteria bacterium RIFCSPLOWO2_02_FULL_62_12]